MAWKERNLEGKKEAADMKQQSGARQYTQVVQLYSQSQPESITL